MRPISARHFVATALLLLAVHGAGAQERRQGPGNGGVASNETGEARDERNPFAGLWRGKRSLGDMGDELGLHFTAIDGKYVGYMIVGDGGHVLSQHLTTSASGMTWDSPNSGGGTWVYYVRLAGPDSLVGTLVLRDPPDNLSDVPKGTLVFKRVPAGKSR